MKKRLFREKNLESISTPEQMKEYVAVSRPGIWMILVAILLLLGGFFVWAVFGRLDSRVYVSSVVKDGKIQSYIRMENIALVKAGMQLVTEGKSDRIDVVSPDPVEVTNDIPAYAQYLGGFENENWIYYSTADTELADGIYRSFILVESVPPIMFLFEQG